MVKKKTFHGWLPIWLIRNPLVSGMGAMIGCGLLTILELLGVIKAQPALTFTRFLTKQNKTEWTLKVNERKLNWMKKFSRHFPPNVQQEKNKNKKWLFCVLRRLNFLAVLLENDNRLTAQNISDRWKNSNKSSPEETTNSKLFIHSLGRIV